MPINQIHMVFFSLVTLKMAQTRNSKSSKYFIQNSENVPLLINRHAKMLEDARNSQDPLLIIPEFECRELQEHHELWMLQHVGVHQDLFYHFSLPDEHRDMSARNRGHFPHLLSQPATTPIWPGLGCQQSSNGQDFFCTCSGQNFFCTFKTSQSIQYTRFQLGTIFKQRLRT